MTSSSLVITFSAFHLYSQLSLAVGIVHTLRLRWLQIGKGNANWIFNFLLHERYISGFSSPFDAIGVGKASIPGKGAPAFLSLSPSLGNIRQVFVLPAVRERSFQWFSNLEIFLSFLRIILQPLKRVQIHSGDCSTRSNEALGAAIICSSNYEVVSRVIANIVTAH